MLIFRYLVKEVFVTFIALTAILLFVFMSNQLVQYLNRAAAGTIPGIIIVRLMMLELPNLIGLLIPLGFYIALLIAYGRLYADNEMTVLQACGYGGAQLLKHTLIMAMIVALLVVLITLWVNPIIATERAKLLRSTGVQTLIQTIIPGRFRNIAKGKEVFYVEAMNTKHTKAKGVFLARKLIKGNDIHWSILYAKQAFAMTDPSTFEDYIVLENGREYQGIPGYANYQLVQFEQYKVRLPHPTLAVKKDVRTLKTSDLLPFNNPDRHKAAELQWRLSAAIMVLVLTLLALPLSKVNSRSGKYAKLLPAILIYIIYANFIFVSRDWIITEKLPLWIGIGWLHLLMAGLGLFLWRNQLKQVPNK